MQWLAVVGTLSGGVLGFFSSFIMETVRTKRDRAHRLAEARRQAYVQYLQALTETDSALQALALEGAPADRQAAMAAYRSKSLLASRYQAALLASPTVANAVDDAYRKLRAIRETIATVHLTVGTPGSPEWQAVHEPYAAAVDVLREAMQTDVQRV